jgi:RimJ/RimL family protein N-acetyltransferase
VSAARQDDPAGWPPALRTERLLLRAWRASDAPRLHAMCQDPLIAHYTVVPSPYSPSDAAAFLEATAEASATRRTAAFAVTIAGPNRDGESTGDGGSAGGAARSPTGDVVASVSLGGLGLVDGMAFIGFLAASEHRGRGYVPEAVAAVCRWGFSELGLRRIEWHAEVGNDASRRVAEKVGFRFEGTLRSRLRHRGEWVDAWLAALVADDLA